MQNIKPLSGFLEKLPEEQIIEEKFKEIITKNYSLSWFTPLDTPAIERVETLTSKWWDDNEIYWVSRLKWDKEEEISLWLRFDLTVPLARYVVQHEWKLNFPFRRQHISKSWRGERAQKWRYREFYQADIDIIWEEKLPLFADTEVLFPIYKTLKEIDFWDFVININNRKLLSGFLTEIGITNTLEVISVIDKKDKVKSIEPMLEELNLEKKQIESILELINVSEELNSRKALSFFEKFDNELLKEWLSELSYTYENLLTYWVEEKYIKINPAISRWLNYYTWMVFETFIVWAEWLWSISSWWRYENLCSNFTDKKFPWVWWSIWLSRLIGVLDSLWKIEPHKKTITEILVLNTSEDLLKENLKIVKELKEMWISTELFLDWTRKFAKQIKYADNKKIPYVMIFWENEKEKNIFALKKLETWEQKTFAIKELSKVKEVFKDIN